jgi:glyoxylase-like metal-dependent hydrolase (beta-lactamase superfamily II)
MHARTTIAALAGATALAGCFATTPSDTAETAAAAPDVELYRLSCGEMHVADKNLFSTEGYYPDQDMNVVISCYLIRHGDEWMLWDAGLPDALADSEPAAQGPFTPTVPVTLASQLEALGLTASDIDYFAISHSHFDHVGNAPAFAESVLVLQRPEFEWVWAEDGYADARAYLGAWEDGEDVRYLDGDTDFFGDGTVNMISLPGHTPGHQALRVELADAGRVILSGDQYHFDENRERRAVPTFNTDAGDTQASSDKLEAIIAEGDALFVIQHEPDDVGDLPAFPEALR